MKGYMERQYGRSVPQMKEVEICGGGTSYLCGFLPLGAEDGDMPNNRLLVSSA